MLNIEIFDRKKNQYRCNSIQPKPGFSHKKASKIHERMAQMGFSYYIGILKTQAFHAHGNIE